MNNSRVKGEFDQSVLDILGEDAFTHTITINGEERTLLLADAQGVIEPGFHTLARYTSVIQYEELYEKANSWIAKHQASYELQPPQADAA